MTPDRTAGIDDVVVLTGATSGIGRATAFEIATEVKHLILHGIEPESQVDGLLTALRAAMPPGSRLHYFSADFGDADLAFRLAASIREVTDRVRILVNNAARPGPATRTLSRAGNEITLETNYLAPVALTTGLMELIGVDGPGRVVNIASATHMSATLHLDDIDLASQPYSQSGVYAHSKLALVTYSNWLAAHRPRATIDVVSMHPGVVSTDLLHSMFGIEGDPPEHAAGNIRFVAAQEADNGAYYDQRSPATPSPESLDGRSQDKLHDITMSLLRQASLLR